MTSTSARPLNSPAPRRQRPARTSTRRWSTRRPCRWTDPPALLQIASGALSSAARLGFGLARQINVVQATRRPLPTKGRHGINNAGLRDPHHGGLDWRDEIRRTEGDDSETVPMCSARLHREARDTPWETRPDLVGETAAAASDFPSRKGATVEDCVSKETTTCQERECHHLHFKKNKPFCHFRLFLSSLCYG